MTPGLANECYLGVAPRRGRKGSPASSHRHPRRLTPPPACNTVIYYGIIGTRSNGSLPPLASLRSPRYPAPGSPVSLRSFRGGPRVIFSRQRQKRTLNRNAKSPGGRCPARMFCSKPDKSGHSGGHAGRCNTSHTGNGNACGNSTSMRRQRESSVTNDHSNHRSQRSQRSQPTSHAKVTVTVTLQNQTFPDIGRTERGPACPCPMTSAQED